MRVSIVLPFINLTGGIRVLLDYANAMHEAGHQVTVVYPCWPYRFQYTRTQQWREFQKHRRQDRVPWFDLRCRLVRAPLIRTAFLPRADVIVAAGWPTAHDVARLHASRGRKVQIVFHHEAGTGPEARIRATYRLPFYRIAHSDFVRRTIEGEFHCAIDDVVPNGVNAAVFFPDGEAEPGTVLFLYHPDPRKGADDGIEALTQLRSHRPELKVRVVGTVRPQRLPDWMPFEFHPNDATLRRRYSTSWVLLYPSRYEGFGLPPLEAMACGCPSVATSVGAIPEYACDGRDALLVPVGDVNAMVAQLDRVLQDATLRERLSLEAKATANRYALPRVAPLFADALACAVASPIHRLRAAQPVL